TIFTEEYRGLIESFVTWCNNNRLKLNISKTKLVVDYQRNRRPPVLVVIQGEEVKRVDSYKHLGVQINKKLDWTHNTEALFRKGQSRLFYLRRLRSFSVCNRLLQIFYQSVVASALFFAVVCWGGGIKAWRRTVTRRIEDIAGNLQLQLQREVASFDFFSLALDESCDVRDTAQLLIFVRGITDFKITEELAAMRSMKGTTTGSDLFTEVNACMDTLGLKWDRLAGVTTDGCPNLTGKNVGLLKRMQDKVTEIDADQKLVFLHCIIHQHVLCKSVLKINHVIDVVAKTVNFIRARALNHRQFVALLEEHETEQSDIGYHTAVRWLSLGKVLKRVWDLKAEIREFCEKKGKDIPELSDEDWMADFAFAVIVTALMNELNTKLQGKGLFVHEMHSLVKAFMRKMQFLSSQLESNTLTHMQTLKEDTPSADHLRRYSSMLGALHGEFSRRFEDLRIIEDEMHMISSPFTCSVDNAPSDVQLELIDLQSDAVLAEHFKSGSLLDFYSSLKEENFPNMRRHAQKMLVLFGSTYICEQTFSMMKFTKSRYRSSLTDDHLSAVLRISTSDIQPDFDALVKAQ
ncbi:general transcription factor II-I repeat domain-containing protein 2A-like, partial [Centroberyx affinis]|uniref:general transcription factor II-I repeat domain-containing protein 2A-like n=1 Tax=Centroberyx affinis TaxID=166261 RepID=UPI003A5C0B43